MKVVQMRLARFIILIAICFGLSVEVAQAEIKASNQSGSIAFAGKHAGMSFDGKFERWQASLVLPPLANPSITATFQLQYAKTGDSTYDSTLPETDWFDVESHPQGEFVSSEVIAIAGGYQVSGNLTLRGISKPLSFVLKDKGNELTATFAINRLDYKIGMDSDPDAEWVSKTISMELAIRK